MKPPENTSPPRGIHQVAALQNRSHNSSLDQDSELYDPLESLHGNTSRVNPTDEYPADTPARWAQTAPWIVVALLWIAGYEQEALNLAIRLMLSK